MANSPYKLWVVWLKDPSLHVISTRKFPVPIRRILSWIGGFLTSNAFVIFSFGCSPTFPAFSKPRSPSEKTSGFSTLAWHMVRCHARSICFSIVPFEPANDLPSDSSQRWAERFVCQLHFLCQGGNETRLTCWTKDSACRMWIIWGNTNRERKQEKDERNWLVLIDTYVLWLFVQQAAKYKSPVF